MMNSSEAISSSFKVLPEVKFSARKDGKKYQIRFKTSCQKIL